MQEKELRSERQAGKIMKRQAGPKSKTEQDVQEERGKIPVVLVDDREGHNDVVQALKDYGASVHWSRLSLGDYFLDDELCVERKTLADLAVSIIDGRLFKQAGRLVNADALAVLILEGTAQDAAAMKVSREAVQGALITVSLVLGLPVLRTASAKETAWLMLSAVRQITACRRAGRQRAGYKPKVRRRRQLFLLQGLPNIGREKADLLLEAFGGVQAVMDAPYEELIKVKGIGKSTAGEIRRILREPLAGYGQASASPEQTEQTVQTVQTVQTE